MPKRRATSTSSTSSVEDIQYELKRLKRRLERRKRWRRTRRRDFSSSECEASASPDLRSGRRRSHTPSPPPSPPPRSLVCSPQCSDNADLPHESGEVVEEPDNNLQETDRTPLQIEDLPQEPPAETPLPVSLLSALGDPVEEVVDVGDEIHTDIASRWTAILKNGLNKEQRKELQKTYPVPSNCPLLKGPKLNAEVEAALTESTKNRDRRMEKKQELLSCAVSALGKAVQNIINDDMDKPTLLKIINDSSRLLCDLQQQETESRKKLILPSLDKSLTKTLSNRQRDDYLFGDKLGEAIKSTNQIKKTGLQLQAPKSNAPFKQQSTSGTKRSQENWRGPPRQQAPQAKAWRGARQGGPNNRQPFRSRQQPQPSAGRTSAYRPPPQKSARRH